MKKCLIILLLLVLLTGCTQQKEEFISDHPTLPEFTPELTPHEQLEAAVSKTRAARSMVLTFGLDDALTTQTVTVDSGGSYTSLLEAPDHTLYHTGLSCYRLDTTQDPPTVDHIESDTPYTQAQIFQDVSALFPDDGLLERFCAQPLTASPSNDGSFCYQLTELSVSQIYTLIHGTEPENTLLEDDQTGIGTVSLTVDPEGYFSQLLIQVYVSDTTHTLQLSLTDLDSAAISPPSWLPAQ